MTGRMVGKRVAVIGAGSVGAGWGNGKAAAVLYAREGAQVLCVDRSEAAAAETAALITGEGGVAYTCEADLTDPVAANAMAHTAQGNMGGLDVLHFNIGTSVKGGLDDTSFDDWQTVFAINLDAAFHATKACVPLMGQGGAIVYISSLAGRNNGPYRYIGYEASKAALQRFSRSIAIEYAPRGIRANTVVPGMIDTPHVAAMIAPGQDMKVVRAARAAQVPLKRQGTAWDIAEAALFLVSDAAGFITGVDLRVDGGMGTLMGTSAG
ncbi:SDR family NAD(P)-dependent oxidoreductase [Donghicola sp.]|jgi:NAD(P)-dependent dehydrogenase (short-subunit alcohol dehydrogenase family)|uniref:SDR family NAD(P)-dependent oxidoreductase n=1 Tax=Donghicola sp. TaxID=1929294 RepID=UPI0025EAF547|nr:SDR family NAD(P)-dependent oxidoreductase [Donghicola sp.]MCT4578657.1 SDR family oxidoreductase [Donghicola sp.]